MIRLTDIRKAGNNIYCAAYLEDCGDPVRLIYQIAEREFIPFDFPPGYEWCKTHINHAGRFFESVRVSALPKEKLIMWY